MLSWAVERCTGPVAVRYPRGGEGDYQGSFDGQKALRLQEGKDITLVTYGDTVNAVLNAARSLRTHGIEAEVIKLQCISPVDWTPVLDSVRKTGHVLMAEECAVQGCIGQTLAAQLALEGVATKSLTLCNVGEGFVTHGSVQDLRKLRGLDAKSLENKVREALGR